ncbi:MAG: barstar family protein [Arachnia propionica]|uniref:barstar family protein n=1 Tax=Arachnia propionica TaxID=1750 RepID=UPI0027025FBA|nr:barstar family protein [Arachnia propionica]
MSRIDELRSALHDAGWDVVDDGEGGEWVVRHHFLPVPPLTLHLDVLDWMGRELDDEQAYGCRVEELPELDLYLSRNRVTRREAIAEFVQQLTEHAHRTHRGPVAPTTAPAEYVLALRNVRSSGELLRLFAKTFRFPDHFGGTWAALDDCMRDLAWLQEGHVVVRLRGMDALAERDPALHRGLVDSVELWQAHWQGRGEVVQFVVEG